jgi:hypothetical protein
MSWAKKRAAEFIETRAENRDKRRSRLELIRVEKRPLFERLVSQIKTYVSEFCEVCPQAQLLAQSGRSNDVLLIGRQNSLDKTEVTFDSDRNVIIVRRAEFLPLSGPNEKIAEVRIIVDDETAVVTTEAGDVESLAKEILDPVFTAADPASRRPNLFTS